MNVDDSVRFATRRPAAVGAACAVALMAGALGGVWAGGLAVPDERVEAPATRMVRAGTARIEVPQAWQTVRSTGQSVVLAPSPPLRDRVVLTVGAADHASLVPASLRARIQGLGQGPRTVQLAGHPAWRYRGLVGRGKDEALDVTVLPGRDTVLSVACVASVRDALAAPDCAGAITSVSLGGAPTLVPAPDLALRQQLPGVLDALDRTRTEARAALGAADTGGTQARWARRLEAAHVSAAEALRPVAADSGAPLIEALSVSARAYRALARTAGAPSASRFRQAQREVRASDARLAGAVDAVAQRPVLIAATPARSPAPDVTSASAPGWLLPAIVLSALLVGGLVTLALRRPALRPPSRPQEHAAPPRRPAPPPPGRPQEHTTPPRRPAPPPPSRPQEHAAPPDVRHPLTAGRWDASPTPGPESVDDPRRSGAAAT